jgi:hypothetical protein
MITQIGIVAGEIWHLLDQKDWLSIQDICSKLGRAEYTVLMSLGWLAREGHIVLDMEGENFSDYKVSLRKKERETVKE